MSPSDPQLPFDRPPEEGRPRRVDLDGEVSLKFKEHAGFFEERPANLSPGGMFVRSRSPQPPGTTFDFELTLQGQPRVIHGIGEVAWVREGDEGFDRPPGMGVRFLSLEPESRALVERIVAERLREEEREEVPPPASTALPEAPLEPSAAPEPEPEPEPHSAPEPPLGALGPPDPGRYAYARSYQGAAVERRSRRRPLLALLLVLLALVIAVAGLSLLFPETAVRLLLGEEEGGGEPAVAARSEAGPGPGGVEGERPGAPAAAEPGELPEEQTAGDGDGEGEEQLGFFDPPSDARPEPEPPAPAPAPAPTEAPPPAPEPAAAPGEARFSRVLNVIWEERTDGELLVTVFLDGVPEEWDYTVTRLGVPPPRALVVIQGVEEPFPRAEIPVGTELVERIRLGFHPERPASELHLVLDLADPGAEVLRSEAEGREIRLYVGPSTEGSPAAPPG